MCDLIAIQANYSMGEAVHTGVTMIADGSEEAAQRLDACTDDRLRYRRRAPRPGRLPPEAREAADGNGPLTTDAINVPLWWAPTATFGPEG